MSLGKVPMKAGGGAKRNTSIKQGTQVSTVIQRAVTTTRHHHIEKLSGDTYKPASLLRPAKRQGRGGANCYTNAQFGAGNSTSSKSEFVSSKAQQRPVCQIGAHDPQTPLTSISSILS